MLEIIRTVMKKTKKTDIDNFATDTEIGEMAKAKKLDARLEDAVLDYVHQAMWHLKEAVNDFKVMDVKMDEIENAKEELSKILKSDIEPHNKMHEMIDMLAKMGKAMDMSWTKEIDEMI